MYSGSVQSGDFSLVNIIRSLKHDGHDTFRIGHPGKTQGLSGLRNDRGGGYFQATRGDDFNLHFMIQCATCSDDWRMTSEVLGPPLVYGLRPYPAIRTSEGMGCDSRFQIKTLSGFASTEISDVSPSSLRPFHPDQKPGCFIPGGTAETTNQGHAA